MGHTRPRFARPPPAALSVRFRLCPGSGSVCPGSTSQGPGYPVWPSLPRLSRAFRPLSPRPASSPAQH